MKNAGMAGAVALVGIGLLSIGLSNFANRAQAVPSAVVTAGPDEPVIVAFGSLGGASTSGWQTGFYRLWSDSRIEVRLVKFNRADLVSSCNYSVISGDSGTCGPVEPADSGWLTLPDPPGGDGFACRGDINGDRSVNAADLGLLIAQWGDGVSCDPQPTYPCFDLSNLSIAAAK